MRLLILLLFISCGKEYIEVVKTIPSEPVIVNNTEYIDKIEYITQDFEGIFYFDHNSIIELIVDYNNTINIVSSVQSLTINNKDNTFGVLPIITGNKLLNNNNIVKLTVNLNYTANHNIKDYNNNVIIGQKRTDITLKMSGNDLSIELIIYSDRIGNPINCIINNIILK